MSTGDVQIRICWPLPDNVCLQGGCIYCRDHPFRSVSTVTKYASDRGMRKDLEYGLKAQRHQSRIAK